MTNLTKLRSEIVPPVTWETLEAYAQSIFEPIKNGECVTSIWLRMAGRRLWNKFIIENIHLFPEQVENEKYLLIYIEPLDLTEQSPIGYLRLIGNSIIEKIKTSDSPHPVLNSETVSLFQQKTDDYTKLLIRLKELLHNLFQSNTKLVLLLGEFDELEFADTTLYNNLKSLWNNFRPNLSYVFLVTTNVDSDSMYSKYKDIIELIRQNVEYTPLLKKIDSEYLVEQFLSNKRFINDQAIKSAITGLCGGHPYLIKVCTKIINNLIKTDTNLENTQVLLQNHGELISIARSVINSLGINSQQAIKSAINGTAVSSTENLAFKLGILKQDNNGKVIFGGKLFELVSRNTTQLHKNGNQISGDKLSYDQLTGSITINGEELDDFFTRQEYELLTAFIKEPNKVKSRDDIGGILWGDNAYEKYSDWAIDQIMSKLRKKLTKLGLKENIITTIRGRGYKLAI